VSRLDPGSAGRLGAHCDGDGVNLAVWSRHAERIELCVFDPSGRRELARHTLPGRTGDIHHGRLPGAGPGLVYGLRAHGPYAPRDGHRFNPHKLLIDPYARDLVGRFTWDDAVLGYRAGHPDGCESFDDRDSAPFVPKARVAAPLRPARERPPAPRRPWGETVLYELHVRGFTARHPGVPEALRGTVEGLADPAAIAHLRALGVTAVELLPVAAWLDELHLVRRGRVNYWGYNPIAFSAMQPALAGPRGLAAMVDAVDALHDAGIEVILDVVYNHTGEGDERGPTLSLRGLDNATYYRPDPHRPGGYANLTGCGNTLAAQQPAVGELILDALRFWAGEVGVDGFRFDLASAIARDSHGRFDPHLPWLQAMRDDPVLSRCKRVAEGWDCEGHFVGGFPPGWSEWNDRYRDDLRQFWRGDAPLVPALATRVAGSSDVFGGRGPTAGINFLTAHDGFTLADLVSYRHKRNHDNGEDNRDGTDANHSDDCGADGATADATVLARRRRRMRAMIASLMLSRGVPMLRAGDEFAATQDGNNNAYGQDGPLTWLAWPDDCAATHEPVPADPRAGRSPDAPAAAHRSPAPADLRGLLATLARLRAAWPCLRAEWFFHGRPSDDEHRVPDVAWLREDGEVMTEPDWHDGGRRVLAMLLDAGAPRPGAPRDRVWIGFVAGDDRCTFRLPAVAHAGGWVRVLDTSDETAPLEVDAGDRIAADGPAVVVCVAGAIAAAECTRWTVGPAAASFVPAGDPAAEIDVVVPADAGPHELVVTPPDAPANARTVPVGSRVVEACRHDGRLLHRRRVRLPAPLPVGVGSVQLRAVRAPAADAAAADPRSGVPATGRLYAAPPRCFLPPALARPQGAWALSVQLYALHSEASWGIGDFDDLARLARHAGAAGAAGLLVSPLHAPSLGWPDRASPYSPASRLALNPLFVSLPRAAEAVATPLFDAWCERADARAALAAVRAAPMVDHAAVLALKRAGLERLWSDFRAGRDTALAREPARAFDAWRVANAWRLRAHGLFEALAEHHGIADTAAWPPGHEHPDAPAVQAFERAHPERLGFHAFVQWLAARQWEAVGEAAHAAGATIGPIADLAVGADPAGADSWARLGLVARDHELGAPPDAFARDGQAWGLPPWRPDAMAAAGQQPFDDLLRATMAGAGGLRIDHVMALERLFWVPRHGRAADGAYVAYPLDSLLRMVALQSERHRCLVIGEDLGTVRDGFRERIAHAGVLSTRVAWFERDADGRFPDPRSLPALAAVCASTHDLPTIDGWAVGADLDERVRLGGVDADTEARWHAERRDEFARIEDGLARHGIDGADLTERLHRWLAATACRLVLVQLEDVAGQARQANLPGTPDQPPNWRQRLPLSVDRLPQAPRWQALRTIFAARHSRG